MWSMERSRGPPNTQYVTIWLCFGATWLLFGPAGAGFACLSNPCVHGVCMDDLNSSYSCYCIDGYTGVQCQTNWDECWSSPCRNGGTCIDGVASYNCSCPEGFIGNDCEENFDECLSSPCQNNGTCIDVDNGYRCCCMDGFLGEHCEHDVAVCNSTSTERCKHGGQCVEGPGLEFYCRCPPGWQGKLCSDDIDECASSPCQNGGVCIDKMASYSCACFLGYTGTDCQVEVAVCDDSPCSNNAICLTEDDLPVCYCVPDFHGERCEMQYDECQLGPRCTNGGTCIDGVDGFTCSCPHHLTGILCECLILDNNQLDCTYIAPSTIEPNITDRTTLTTEYDVFSTMTTTQKETTTYVDFTTELSTTTTDADVTEISTLDTPTTTEFTTEYSTVSTSGGSTTIYDIFTTFITTITPFTSSQTTLSPDTTTEEFTELTTLFTETTTMFSNLTTGFTDYTTITITTPGITDITTVGMTDTEFTTLTTLITTTTESPTSETTIIPITKSPEGRESNDSITFTTRIPENITEFFTESPGITTLTSETTTSTPYTMKPTITTTEYTTLSTTDIDMGTQHTTQTPDCNATKCQNGGECIHTSEGNRCVCPFRWEGALCEVKIMIKTAAFSGDSYISHHITNVSDINVQLKAKTISPNGILVYGGIDDDAYLSVYLENGLLKFKFSCGIQTMLLSELEAPVNTGYEMCIDAKLVFNQNFTHCNATLKVNDTLTMSGDQTSLVTSGNIWTSANKPRAWLHLGGAPVQSTSPVSDVADGFVGCIHSLQIGGQTKQIFNDAMDGFEVTECSSLACLSHPCKNGAKCQEDGEKWSCTCRTGFVGKSCERSICENNPCLYGATCTPFPATGFICLCPLGKHGQYCEYNFEIVQPSFASSLNGLSSFAAYPIPTAIRHSMEMRFKIIPNTLEQISLLAFMGQEGMHDSSSDHVAVSFVKGYIMLTWNLGSGPRRIFTSSPIVPKVNKPNIIRIGRTDRRAWLFVDNMGNITGRSPGHLTQLDVESVLYIGGHEAVNFSTLPHDLPFHTGFSGCIFDVEMRAGRSLVSIEDSRLARGRGVGRCETSECHAYACQKGGACLQHGAAFSCLCQDGSFGPLCTEKSNLCDTKYNKCHSSAVCVLTISGFECDCPFGRTGLYCETLGNITDVSFSGRRSFLSLQVPAYFPFLSSQYSMSMEIRPLGEEGLVLFSGNAMGFACLSLQGGVLEFRVKGRNSHTMIIRSGRVLALGEWHNLRIGRYGRRVHMWVEGVVNAGTTHPADSAPFYLDDDIYIGGLSDLSTLPYNALQGYPVSFKGCVRKLQINSMRLPLNESHVRESRNVHDCDGTPCGGDFCEHGGACRLDNASLPMCSCSSRHHGERCEVTVSCSEEPCEHDGRCVRRRENEPSRCACPLGWGGQFCETAVKGKSPQFSGNSFLLLDKQRSSIKDKRSKTDIRLHPNVSFLRFNFSTMEPDGVILWCSTGPDYLGIGVKGGFIKLASSLLSTEKGILEIPSSNQVSDGDWHEMSLTINDSNLTMKLDQTNIYSKTRDHWNINILTEGSFYLGGFPEDESTEQHTSGIFTNTFTGCLQELSLGDENSITDFSHYKGENIGSCEL